MKTKKEVLELNGYTSCLGYILNYDKPDDNTLNLIITREEVEDFYNKKPTLYYWNERYDYMETEAEAWESFTDSYVFENGLDITQEECDKILLGDLE